ncbi:hypothetical protein, partial [Pseudovibrio axinellae]
RLEYKQWILTKTGGNLGLRSVSSLNRCNRAEKITQRQAVVPEYAWPAPSHKQGEKRPKIEKDATPQMSQWLIDAEIPVEGVDTMIADPKE